MIWSYCARLFWSSFSLNYCLPTVLHFPPAFWLGGLLWWWYLHGAELEACQGLRSNPKGLDLDRVEALIHFADGARCQSEAATLAPAASQVRLGVWGLAPKKILWVT